MIQLSRYNSLTLKVTDKDVNSNLLSFSWSVSFIVLWLLVGRKVLKNGLNIEKEFVVFFSLMPNMFFVKRKKLKKNFANWFSFCVLVFCISKMMITILETEVQRYLLKLLTFLYNFYYNSFWSYRLFIFQWKISSKCN